LETDAHDLFESVIPVSYGSTVVIETGKWGFQKPHTAFMTAPCQEACPAGNPIPQFLYLASEGRYDEALQFLLKENPLPGACGRVCFHPCEGDCNRGKYDESVSIRAAERYLSDAALNQFPGFQPISNKDSKEVAVVGSGPAGLACAYFLGLLGRGVTIFEAKEELGGILRWGIPEYRLPKSELKKEIRRILNLPIRVKTKVTVGKDIALDEMNGFDAIFLSPGAGLSAPLNIEGETLKRVLMGGDFLGRMNSGGEVPLGREVIVIGGGNTAMDVARCALRLGSRVTVAYRRTRAEMPAIKEETLEAEEEGARLEFLIQPVAVKLLRNRKLAVIFQRMSLSDPDQTGRPMPIPMEGEFLTLKADHLITAVGENLDLSWLPPTLIKNGLVDVDTFFSASQRKIFAGGDAIHQPRSVVTAIAAGKKAAISIDLSFRGYVPEEVFPRIRVGNRGAVSMEAYLSGLGEGIWPEPKDVISYEKMNTLFFEHSPRVTGRKLNREDALKGFAETVSGLSREETGLSASRCFSCGTCNYCYNCYFFCPEGAISLDPVHQTKTVDFEHCKGCGTCAKACPRNVVEMKDVP